MIICPNFSNPDVAREFEELKAATSEKAAYAIWSLNNGNAIDKAPNGAQSKLFQDLLQLFNGDRTQAIRAKAKVYGGPFMQWFGDWINDPVNASKVVDENGEPMVMYHGSPNKFTIFDINKFGKTDPGTFGKGFYFTSIENRAARYGGNVMPVFINARNLIDGYKNEVLGFVFGSDSVEDVKKRIFDQSDTGMTQEEKEAASSLITKEVVEESKKYDGVDGSTSSSRFAELSVRNPNQIKSAIENNGTFSTENDDILFHVNRRVNGTGNLSDEIQKEGYTTPQIVENVIQFLSSKFPGLKIHMVDDVSSITREDEIEQSIVRALLSGKHISSIVYHGEVYIVRSKLSKQGGQIASEEILHMLIRTLQDKNPQLFKSLLDEAKRSFKKLTKEIEGIYKEAGKYTIENEIVTQALARYVNRDIQAGKHSRFAELVNKFVSWLKSILIKSSEQVGNFVYIDPSQLKSLTLQELSDLINAEDTRFDINLQSYDILYHMDQSITRQLYNAGIQIDFERNQYINSVVFQYIENNPEASPEDVGRIRNNARKQFNTDKSNQIMREKQNILAQTFGLTMNRDGFYESSETSQKKLMLEYFINSLQDSTFKAYNLENINRTKYQQVGSVQNVGSIGNVIYHSLYEGDLITLDKEIARDYVRMFWGSDLIQSALDSLKTANETSKQLEDRLVDRMTREPAENRSPRIIEWFRNIWDGLSNLIKTVFGQHQFTDEQKNNILKAVDAAFMLSEDLEYTNNNSIIYDRQDGNYNSSIMLSDPNTFQPVAARYSSLVPAGTCSFLGVGEEEE